MIERQCPTNIKQFGEQNHKANQLSELNNRTQIIILSIIFFLGLLAFSVGVFKHISYPLMWADESMTAVGAQRVLEYGYPKVHDGKNVLYDLFHADLSLGIDKKTDAFIGGAGWGHYYFAAPFVALSQSISDMYLKTAILRIPFALVGCAGLFVLLWMGVLPLENTLQRLAVGATFIALELPCISLILHLREVRYYSLQLMLTALAISVFAAYHLYSLIRFRTYAVAIVCLVPLLFITFSPASVAFYATICLYICVERTLFIEKAGVKDNPSTPSSILNLLKPLYPLIGSLVLVLPQIWFFQTLHISRKLSEFYHFTFSTYLENLYVVWGYFSRYDIIVFAIIAKILLFLFRQYLRSELGLLAVSRFSFLLTIYVIVQVLLVCFIPNTLYTRYFIMLQPLIILSFALDLLIIVRLSFCMGVRIRMICIAAVPALLVGGIGWSYYQNREAISGRFYEVNNQYQGCLDFVIPYLKEYYKSTEQIVIATNYEETAFIYYLGSRVIVGFRNPDLKDNLQQILTEKPDCIIYRNGWAGMTDKRIFEALLRPGEYHGVRFPIRDSLYNNIPELWHWDNESEWKNSLHVFSTPHETDPNHMITMFLRL